MNLLHLGEGLFDSLERVFADRTMPFRIEMVKGFCGFSNLVQQMRDLRVLVGSKLVVFKAYNPMLDGFII